MLRLVDARVGGCVSCPVRGGPVVVESAGRYSFWPKKDVVLIVVGSSDVVNITLEESGGVATDTSPQHRTEYDADTSGWHITTFSPRGDSDFPSPWAIKWPPRHSVEVQMIPKSRPQPVPTAALFWISAKVQRRAPANSHLLAALK